MPVDTVSSTSPADRAIRRRFIASALVPPALALVLAVLVPVFGLMRTTPPPPIVPADLTEADRLALGQLADRLADVRYLEARLALAKRGQLGLSLNRADSVLQVELNGVPLHRARVLDASTSRQLPRLAAAMEAPLFTLSAASATIPKIPLRVVEAPRDSAEANARPPEDILVETRPPHVVLHFAEGLTVWLRPSPSTLGGELLGTALTVQDRLQEGTHIVRQVADGHAPVPAAWIELVLAPEDVRTIYRALPADAALALRWQ